MKLKPFVSSLFLPLLTSFILFGCADDEPPLDHQTSAEKQKEVFESFSGENFEDGSQHADGIRKFFDQLPVATGSNDYAKVNQLFATGMLFRLLEKENLVPAWIKDAKRFIAILEKKLAPQFCDPVQGIHYGRYEIRNVRFLREGREALVYLKIWTADQVQIKMRWWLHRNDGLWRAYDYEVLDMSLRFSTLTGLGMKMAEGNDRSLRRFPTLMQGCEQLAQGDSPSALVTFKGLQDAGFPMVLESLRLFMLSACLSDTGEFQEAILVADRAMAMNPDMPMAHSIYAISYNGLGKHEEALKHATQYANSLGKDGDYYTEVGDAYLGLGKKDQAIRAYRNGITDDPQSAGFCVLGLMKALPKSERKEVLFHYERLASMEDRFLELGNYLVGFGSADTLRALIEVHEHFLPLDENLEHFREALRDMK